MQLPEYLLCKIQLQSDALGCNSMVALCQKFSIDYFWHHLPKAISRNYSFRECGAYMASDFLPFDGSHYYIPKPETTTAGLKTLTITEQKALRTIRFIPLADVDAYLSGHYDYLGASKNFFGKIVTSEGQTAFRVDIGSGIYFVFHCHNQAFFNLFDKQLDEYLNSIPELCFSKEWIDLPDCYRDALQRHTQQRLSLSSLLSDVDTPILEKVCNNATFALQERKVLRIDAESVTEKRVCIIASGACINHDGFASYNEAIPSYWGRSISIGMCREVK